MKKKKQHQGEQSVSERRTKENMRKWNVSVTVVWILTGTWNKYTLLFLTWFWSLSDRSNIGWNKALSVCLFNLLTVQYTMYILFCIVTVLCLYVVIDKSYSTWVVLCRYFKWISLYIYIVFQIFTGVYEINILITFVVGFSTH